ncbi:glycine betaine/L-proline ABC transporter ATP-binding protein ProV [Denitromonas iodatirespirans]|uniref:Quaternary amine transport ATP-binding protein n=1 Tax=Denitromonas iodatirespirans TaxID=2795389 RepID=A0A944DC96_DENI1|nr:glycine betaine/L-proline ABC transporter ATP-binding protein ProV [Denitromonas iodatirespirans]MBT0964155.1 glycine betaine/L-proline ABC transporter ATP-binding protein ProV [Denitromonas iodatirespirans]
MEVVSEAQAPDTVSGEEGRVRSGAAAEDKLVVRNLYKIFGNRPEVALQMLREGRDKDEILKETGQVVGVRDASFTVKKGEIFVIMGLSGSGKSTLIRLLNRLIEPSAGEVVVDGVNVAAMSKSKLLEMRRHDMSMVFQSFALLPQRTVLDNAAFGLEVRGVARDERERRAMEVLDQVGLASFAKSYPAQLSGGMQQRVGLARALASNPSIMLMDEAFSALDPLRRTEMQDVLVNLQREHSRTVIFVSHDLDEALRIGDRICIMEGGRVVQVGTSDDILERPADDYVRAFFRGVDVSKYMTAGTVAQKEQVTIFDRPEELVGGIHAALERLRLYDRDYGFVLDQHQKVLGVVSVESLIRCRETGAHRLRDALLPELGATVPSSLPIEDLIRIVVASPCPLPVVDENGRYVGAVTKTVLLTKLSKGVAP